MVKYVIDCEECDEDFESDDENEAVGWMFGHALRTDHDDITKVRVDGD